MSDHVPPILGGTQRYRLVRPIGRGAFGEVLEAEDTLLGRRVAIKAIPFSERIPVLSYRALLSEAQMAAAAGRSAVQVFDLVRADDAATWLVMEFISGGSLRDWVHRPRAAADVGRVVRSLTSRLAVLHELGLVHGDIHPGNLLVRAPNDIAFADFGLARMVGGGKKSHGRHERAWSAPEVLDGDPPTTSADVYSTSLVIRWLYHESAHSPPAALQAGLSADVSARPLDGRALQAVLLGGTTPNARPMTPDESEIDRDLARAATAARLGRTSDAITTLHRAIRRAPSDPRPRKRLALIHWVDGRRQEAVWTLEAAQRLDPRDREITTLLVNLRDLMEEGR